MTRPPLDILREVAERLGYLSVLHGCPPPSADGYEIVAAVDFHGGQHGGQSGTISIGCGPGIGAALAANMLATSKPDFETAREAVLELANVVAGNVIAVLHPDDELRLDPPHQARWPVTTRVVVALQTDEGVISLAVSPPQSAHLP